MKKVVVTVPVQNADAVREAIGVAGGGVVENYSFCSFSSRGTGRFLPNKGARPAIGTVGTLEEVEEERIEITCANDLVAKIITAIEKVHPYEVPAIDIYALEDFR